MPKGVIATIVVGHSTPRVQLDSGSVMFVDPGHLPLQWLVVLKLLFAEMTNIEPDSPHRQTHPVEWYSILEET
jgi:hypothetical protein